jgi:hypothetical protein
MLDQSNVLWSVPPSLAVTPLKTKDTLWALYNAIVRDEDYRKSRDEGTDRRLDRIWFGSGIDPKLKTLRAAQQQMGIAA